MKVGLIGTGQIGTYHASTLATLPAVDTATSDAVDDRAYEPANLVLDAGVVDLDCPAPRTSLAQRHASLIRRTGSC